MAYWQSQAQWHTPATPALGRQETGSSRVQSRLQAGATSQDSFSKEKKNDAHAEAWVYHVRPSERVLLET